MRRLQSQHSRHRGVAMLLVMISLMTATILTTAYLASRDNSTAIGENVANSTAARWAADTGVELAIAALQTEKDWRTACKDDNGRLLRDFLIDGATVDVMLTDLSTSEPPGPLTENLLITATGTVNGVRQSATANAFVPLDPGNVADVDLSEFAVFAGSSLTMTGQSMITRWPMAPLSTLGRRIAIGTRATGSASIVLSNDAAAIDATVYAAPGASSSLVSIASGAPVELISLTDSMPMPVPAFHNEALAAVTPADFSMSGGTATVLADTQSHAIEIKNNAVRTLKGHITVVAEQDLSINTGAKLIIDGNVKIVVFGSLRMDQGSIEVKPTARLRLYVRGTPGSTAVEIRDGYIGDLRANTLRDNSGKALWMDPQRITLFSAQPVDTALEWRIDRNSVIKGSIYAPHAMKVSLEETSALYGRIMSNVVEMKDQAAVFYDPSLDSRCGYTNLESPLYDTDGHIVNSFRTMTVLEPTALQTLADSTGVVIKADAGTRVQCTPSDLVSNEEDDVAPTDPTPRTVQVQYDLTCFGTDVHGWE